MVHSEDWWEHRPGDAVDTTDGYPGVVTAVEDGGDPAMVWMMIPFISGSGS